MMTTKDLEEMTFEDGKVPNIKKIHYDDKKRIIEVEGDIEYKGSTFELYWDEKGTCYTGPKSSPLRQWFHKYDLISKN